MKNYVLKMYGGAEARYESESESLALEDTITVILYCYFRWVTRLVVLSICFTAAQHILQIEPDMSNFPSRL